MKQIKTLLFSLFICCSAYAQETKSWTEADRKYILDNLIRSRDEVLAETKDLSKAQWSFKESPDRWSINEIVEHIAIWELLLCQRISAQLGTEPQPALVAQAVPDSVKLGFIMEEKVHHSADYTKPYTYTIPMGLNDLKNNTAWLLKMRNESITYVTNSAGPQGVLSARKQNQHARNLYYTVWSH